MKMKSSEQECEDYAKEVEADAFNWNKDTKICFPRSGNIKVISSGGANKVGGLIVCP